LRPEPAVRIHKIAEAADWHAIAREALWRGNDFENRAHLRAKHELAQRKTCLGLTPLPPEPAPAVRRCRYYFPGKPILTIAADGAERAIVS